MHDRPFTPRICLAVSLLAAVGAASARLVLGPDGISLPEGDLFELRGLRVLSGLTVGASLGIAGTLMQSLLRNPLASPDLMGVASGSGLFVMLAALVAGPLGWSFGVLAAPAALAGALVTLTLIFVLARTRGGASVVGLTLIGVAIGFMFGSAGMLVQHLLADRGLAAQRWLLGSLRDDLPVWAVLACLAVVGAGLAAGMTRARAMDVSALGDEAARTMGVSLAKHRAVLFFLSGVLAAVSVYLAGPIGFVGLIAPHLVRLMAGPGHRTVLPASALIGAAIVLTADCAVRALDLPSGRLPLGVVTSLIGGPVLIAMLRKR
jgi:iron complex transport system permease protein